MLCVRSCGVKSDNHTAPTTIQLLQSWFVLLPDSYMLCGYMVCSLTTTQLKQPFGVLQTCSNRLWGCVVWSLTTTQLLHLCGVLLHCSFRLCGCMVRSLTSTQLLKSCGVLLPASYRFCGRVVCSLTTIRRLSGFFPAIDSSAPAFQRCPNLAVINNKSPDLLRFPSIHIVTSSKAEWKQEAYIRHNIFRPSCLLCEPGSDQPNSLILKRCRLETSGQIA